MGPSSFISRALPSARWAFVAPSRRMPRALIVSALLALSIGLVILFGAQPARAAACATSGPGGGSSYTVEVCVLEPADGSSLVGDATVSVTVNISGASTGVAKMQAYLGGEYLLTDYEMPYRFTLPTEKFVDGAYQLEIEAVMRDGFITSRTAVATTFANGISQPPVNTNTFAPTPGTIPAPGEPFILAATGDSAGGRSEADDVVATIGAADPNLFLYLGDVYEKGTATEFHNWYGPDGVGWGTFRDITNPVIGNHEYEDGVAPGYFDYWDNINDYYSYDAAGWHLIALSSNSQLDELDPGTPQYEWLEADLAANTAACTIAYFHHPVLSIGVQGDTPRLDAVWKLLSDNGVDIALTGHEHNYQRWVSLDRDLLADSDGITQFVAGSGGHGVAPFVTSDSRVAAGFDTTPEAFGALFMELNADGTAFRLVNTADQVLDSGTIQCGGTSADTAAPSQPADLTAVAAHGTQVDLQWSPSTDNVGVAQYTIDRDGVSVATVDGATTSYSEIGVDPKTTYTYTVVASVSTGNHTVASDPAVETTPRAAPGL